jgi:DNA replication protein DnaC
MVNSASLPLLLKQLGLPMMYRHYEATADEAAQGHWTYPGYLSVLSDLEVSSRRQKRIERHIKESKLPVGKTIDLFDFKAAKSINAAQIQALAENNSWVKQANNLLIFGPSGVGKTHLAHFLCRRLLWCKNYKRPEVNLS